MKLDNRLENLELWSGRHPRGQRVIDKLEFCADFLRLYGVEVEPRIIEAICSELTG